MTSESFPMVSGVNSLGFAQFTLKERFPFIIQLALQQEHSKITKDTLERLLSHVRFDLPEGVSLGQTLEKFQKTDWHKTYYCHLEESWFEAPFFFVEVFFNQLVLDICCYNRTRPQSDPFLKVKLDSLSSSIENPKLRPNLSSSIKPKLLISDFIWHSTVGNIGDLSQLGEQDKNLRLIVDDRSAVLDIFSNVLSRIDLVLDNAGRETLADLEFVDFLLRSELVGSCWIHPKADPFFVSDATANDLKLTLEQLQSSRATQALGDRLQYYLGNSQLVITESSFWNHPIHFACLGDTELALDQSKLIILKGDANYRRLIEDRLYPLDFSPQDLPYQFPAPILACRVAKSEVSIGLPKHEGKKASECSTRKSLCRGQLVLNQVF